jgi:alkyl sulfatase BDS1-like metallo-beta-lactamase superfamily hydrolase
MRLINKGYTPVELQHALADLPAHLYEPPYSVPTYGTPFTTVPEFFMGWVSWFNGAATDMFPSEPKRKAEGFVELMGGAANVLEAAKAAHAGGDHQYAAELAQLIVRAEPDNEDGKLVKAAALRARGYQELNPIARSWYLTGALELEGAIDPDLIVQAMTGMLGAGVPAITHIAGWRYQLDAAAAGDVRISVGVRVTDSGDEVTVQLRNSVLNTFEGIADGVDAVVELSAAELAENPGAATKSAGIPQLSVVSSPCSTSKSAASTCICADPRRKLRTGDGR